MRRLRQIDLALLQPSDQLLGGDVDEYEIVGVAQHRVGHRFAHDDAGHFGDDVGEALKMLDVERRPNVDLRGEQFFNVLPALGVPAFRRVGVGEFVNYDELGAPAQSGVEVEFLVKSPLGFDHAAGQRLQAAHQRVGLGAAVRLNEADDDVDALQF